MSNEELGTAVESLVARLPTEHNWNSYGARPTTPAAREAVRQVFRFLSIVPTNDGGIQIETHTHQLDIEIEFSRGGRLESICWELPAPPESP